MSDSHSCILCTLLERNCKREVARGLTHISLQTCQRSSPSISGKITARPETGISRASTGQLLWVSETAGRKRGRKSYGLFYQCQRGWLRFFLFHASSAFRPRPFYASNQTSERVHEGEIAKLTMESPRKNASFLFTELWDEFVDLFWDSYLLIYNLPWDPS